VIGSRGRLARSARRGRLGAVGARAAGPRCQPAPPILVREDDRNPCGGIMMPHRDAVAPNETPEAVRGAASAMRRAGGGDRR
jgi:hypothetical protein